MDSRPIALALDAAHPTPPLRLAASAEIGARADAARAAAMGPLRLVTIPKVPRNVLGEGSVAYFNRTREKWLGKPLDEYEARGEREEEVWAKAGPAFVQLAAVLKETEGPFLLGADRESFGACEGLG
jgi:glutathione S-transferase